MELQLREADLAAIDDQIGNLHIESPIDGTVLEVARDAGEWIEKGETIATLGQMNRLHIHALVRSELIAPRHCKGLPISVHWDDHIDGTRRSLSGHVLSVDPQALPGGMYRLHAEIINEKVKNSDDQWLLTPGGSVRMKVYVPADTVTARPRYQQLR